ncbi:hypothetical protein LN565_01425 [Xanthomonas euvesicatoria pv. euvesicatoria]|uniref:hypothetical protein n=1 Tax=Xanthomonas euvesicatoria TaxID=456327 RepID=UPI00057F122F|nr:hypothetical protein [Xanthomonas euvesicatoria]KHL63092.1 hypothetical protein XEU83M_20585 [Xanthomonas euvesicatoria]KLA91659.1 hypothetical protein XEUV181_07890 [Xanthomonas euvesicatoria]MCC8501174.1 hypothetical protein [Xanthomonas euvesicatoria pv. euvesicatoria]MCC8568762.1 hypothetical protein [Xanthomonas euvesicatoria pv. euvesicatoria]MCC8742883.1 hypothetical protein [Xanthomonas euvesicatoria pv. euvesicatoria]
MPAVETGPHAPGPEPTATSGRPHKRVRWRQPKPPAGNKRRPAVLDATREALVRSLEQRRGSLWMRISRNVIVAGYALNKALTRVRALRSDGANSLLAMSVALIYLADVRTGFVGKPRQGGGRWHRYTLNDLAQLAYGGQTEGDLHKAKRAIDMMVSLGWAFPTKQVRRHKKGAEGRDLWCSEPGVRRLNFQRLCDMAGTSWLLKRDRKHADQEHGTGVASFTQAQARRQSAQEPATRPRTGDARPAAHRSTGDPPAGAQNAVRHIADILALFK